MSGLFRGSFDAAKKLGNHFLTKEPTAVQIAECREQIKAAEMLSRLLDLPEYIILQELFTRHYDQAIQLLRRGTERSALDELDGIQQEIQAIIKTGQKAKEKLAKLQEK